MKRIGIITYHRVRNYGSVLQAYALLRYLENQGHDVSIMNYIPRAHSTKMEFLGTPEGPILKRMIYLIGSFPIRLKVHSVYKDFRSNYLKLTEHEYRDQADFATHPLDLDVYVTGGDQVWNSRYNFHGLDNGYPYYLDFAPYDRRLVSYASSFGEESMDLKYDPYLGELLKRYDYLSVREASGLDKLKALGRADGVQVLDPVLLLSPTKWLSIIGNARLKEPYLLVYEPQRRDAGKFEKYALGIAEKKKLKIVKISKNYVEPRWIDRAVYPSVNNFLALFANADFVLTNSFHGIVFCLTFEKQFACVPANSANNRIIEMLKMVGLEGRMLHSEEELEKTVWNDIEFAQVRDVLDEKRFISADFLNRAIG